MVEDPPPETLVEEREELMVSPLGGQHTLRTAHFLKPSSIEDIPPFSLSQMPNSSSIKNPPTIKFRGRRCPQKDWETWVNHLQPTHHQTWEKAGIFEAIMASKYQIMRQNDLVIALAERWNPETNTFIFPWGESTLTLEDMMVLGGYSALGSPVFTPLETKELIKAEEDLSKAFKDITRSRKNGFTSHNDWVQHFMDTGNILEHEAFLALWLSRYVLPTTYDTLSRIVFPVAVLLSRGTLIALAPAVLANIYRDLTLLKKSIISSMNLSGCQSGKLTVEVWAPFQLVQVWAWERFPTLRPNPNLIKKGEPRLARWHRLRHLRVENERMELDSAGDCFQWRPYAVVVNNWSFSKFYRENEEWALVRPDMEIELVALALCIRPSELVGLACIEHYLPHRVSMQFGIDQDLPGHVPRFNESTEAAWKNYYRPITDAKIYIPARLFESDVTAEYLSWRTRPELAYTDAIKQDMSSKLSSETRKRLHPFRRGSEMNDKALISSAGFEDEEDNLTIAELVSKGREDGLKGHDMSRPQSSSSLSIGLQKGDCGRIEDQNQINQVGKSIVDANAIEFSGPLQKMNKENGEAKGSGLAGDDEPFCRSSLLLCYDLQRGDLGRVDDLYQTNKDILAIKDAEAAELRVPLEKTMENGEDKSTGLRMLTCASSLSSSKDFHEGDFSSENDPNQTNKSNISLENANAAELNGPLDILNENREDESITSEMKRVRMDLEARVTKLENLIDWIKAGN